MGDAVDHLLDEHGLADARTAEQTDFAALDVRGEQVEDLDAGLQHLGAGLQGIELGGRAVNRPAFRDMDRRGIDVQHIPRHVPDVSLGDLPHGNRDRGPRVTDLRAAAHAVGGFQGDGPDQVVTDVEGGFHRHGSFLTHDLGLDEQGIADLGDLISCELDVHDRTDDPGDAADACRGGRMCSGSHVLPHSLPADSASAAAPPTISEISWVISD